MPDPTDYEGLYMEPDLPEDHRSGFVAVVGKPNVGKSTLMNVFLGEKLAIVSPFPQTTRERQLGILTRADSQIIFLDTPGLHKPRNALGEYMVDTVRQALPDGDVILLIVDVSQPPDGADRALAEAVAGLKGKGGYQILVLNKVDIANELQENRSTYQELFPEAHPVEVSALEEHNTSELLALITEHMPPGPRFYPADQLTQTRLRDNVAEIIREKILMLLSAEVPHSTAVIVEEFKERDENMTYVRATVYVEKDSQKRIVVGKGASMLKEINQQARPDIEKVVGTRVYLELWVKVLKNWRRDENALRRLGYWRKRQ